MKQRIFTLSMMLALVIVTGNAFALNEAIVNPGGLYHYKVNGVDATTDATITVDYVPTSGTDATVTLIDPASILGTDPAVSVTFDVKYGTVAAPANSGNIVVTVSQGLCSNFIRLAVTVNPPPSMTLDLTAATGGGCQNTNANPASGIDASVGAAANDLTFTVVAGTPPTGLASISYTFGVSGMGATSSVAGTLDAPGTFPAVFTTTEGGGGTVTGTISAATFTMGLADGGQTYDMTITTYHQDVTVAPLPTIGAFGN
jgi:hypothetical protein